MSTIGPSPGPVAAEILLDWAEKAWDDAYGEINAALSFIVVYPNDTRGYVHLEWALAYLLRPLLDALQSAVQVHYFDPPTEN